MSLVRAMLARLKRCHPLSWCAMLLTAVVMTLLIVPAGFEREPVPQFREAAPNPNWWARQQLAVYDETQELISYRYKHPPEGESGGRWAAVFPVLWQHGWPMPYLIRAQPAPILGGYHSMRSEPTLVLGRRVEMCNGQPTRFVSWSNYDNWPLESTAWRIHPVGVIVDSAVWLSAVVGFGLLTEWWIRQRQGLLRFRLSDLICALTVVAIGLAWWGYHTRVHRLEQRVNDHFVTVQNEQGLNAQRAYVGPDWVAKLAGDDAYAQHFSHVISARLTMRHSWRDDLGQVVQLPYLEVLSLGNEVPLAAVDLLESVDHLKRLNLNLKVKPQPELRGLPDELLLPKKLHELGRLRLRELRLESRDVLAEDVDRMLAATRLELLVMKNVAMTLDELRELEQRYPNVEFVVRWRIGDKQPPEDIEQRIADIKRERAER